MPLYVTERDRKLMSKINDELITDIIDSKVIYYQISEHDNESNINVYGETTTKLLYKSYQIPALIERDDPQHNREDGKIDYEQILTVYLLRDYLLDHSINIEASNYIKWDNEYYEIDYVVENKYFGDKNPLTSLAGSAYGWDVAIKLTCHLIDRSLLNIEEIRF